MLKHLNSAPVKPLRTVVVGAGGFVGGALVKRLKQENCAVLELTRREVDLLGPDATKQLAAHLEPGDSVVAVAAIAPVKTVRMLVDNMRLAHTLVSAIASVPVAHVINISSDAVYGDEPVPITEAVPPSPASLHGAMHLARELAFAAEIKAPLVQLRPSLLYGASDPHNGYGPNKFRRLAEKGENIVLFGEGEEQRDHVYIDDVAELIYRALAMKSTGTLNIASGEVHSFRSIAEAVAAGAPRKVTIQTSPRSGPMPHKGYRPFDIAACRTAFPEFRYTRLADGLAKAEAQGRESDHGRG